MGYTVTKMTVNQAILILENRIKCNKQEKEEAKQMAIKALKQGDVLHKIRQEIKRERSMTFDDMQEYRQGIDDAITIIDRHIKEFKGSDAE